MPTRWIASGILGLLLICIGILFSQNATADLPPGVEPENWIAINENAGIVLNHWTAKPPTETESVVTSGTLMIRSQGQWRYVFLQAAPGAPGKPREEGWKLVPVR